MTVRRVEAALVAVVFVSTALVGYLWVQRFVRRGGHPFFYQSYFEPAVMLACGHGFVLSRPQPPALAAFLAEKRDSFHCEELPRDLELTTDALVQRPWRYLLTTVALAWKVLGLSWTGLAPLFGAFYAATAVAVYVLCRQLAGPVASLAATAAFSLSPLQLANLANLRDYAKAPFVVWLAALLAAMVVRPLRPGAVVLLALGYGLIMGIGYGFRTDLLIAFPPLVVAIVLFLPGGITRQLLTKVVALGALATGFLVAAAPILSSVASRGGCQWHFSLLGLTDPFNEALGVGGGAYSWGHLYKDEYLWATISSYAARLRPDLGYIEYCSREYDIASGGYLRSVLATFPADILTRAYAAVFQVLDLPFRHVIGVPYLGTLAAILFVGGVAMVNRRLALFATFAIAYFGGHTAIQFLPRHFFPFEFVSLAILAVIVDRAMNPVAAAPGALQRATVFVVAVIVVLAIPLLILRSYQNRVVIDLLDRYAVASATPAPLEQSAAGRFRLPRPLEGPGSSESEAVAALGRTRGRVLELAVAGCRAGSSITFDYDPTFPVANLSYTLPVSDLGRAGPTRIFEPVYAGFTGFTVSDAAPSCVVQASYLEGLERVPLHLPAQLTRDWRAQPQYQQIKRFR